jgi:hypothetical protein
MAAFYFSLFYFILCFGEFWPLGDQKTFAVPLIKKDQTFVVEKKVARF